MSDTTSDVLRALLDASDDRKNVAVQVLRGELTTCPYLRSKQSASCDDVVRGEAPLLMAMGASAKYLGVSRSTLWRICQAGKLKRVELFHGSYRLRRLDLDALAARNAVGPSGSMRGRWRKKTQAGPPEERL
jgi:excisionase family DNA binding protein